MKRPGTAGVDQGAVDVKQDRYAVAEHPPR